MSAELWNADSPRGLAYRMTSYIKDPHYIVGYVEREYGRSRAPSLQTIERMIQRRQKANLPRVSKLEQQEIAIERRKGERANKAMLSVVPITHVRHVEPAPATLKPWPRWYSPQIKPVFARDIIAGVAADFGITADQLLGKSRSKNLVAARAVVARILRDRNWSFPKIGIAIGRRDHSTIINLIDKFDIYLRDNETVQWSYGLRKIA